MLKLKAKYGMAQLQGNEYMQVTGELLVRISRLLTRVATHQLRSCEDSSLCKYYI